MKKNIFVIIFCFIQFTSLFAQNADSIKLLSNKRLLESFNIEQNHQRFLRLFDEVKKRKYSVQELSEIYNTAGDMYAFIQDYKNARYYFLKSYQISKKIGNINTLSAATFNLAETEYRLENYKESQQYYTEFKPLLSKIPDGMRKVTLQTDYYKMYYLNGDFEKYFKEIKKLYAQTIENEKLNKDANLTTTFIYVKLLYLSTLLNTSILMKDQKNADYYMSELTVYSSKNKQTLDGFKDIYQNGTVLLAKIRYYIIRAQYSKALLLLSELETYSKNNHYKDYYFIGLVTKAYTQYMQNNYKDSYQTSLIAQKNIVPTLDFFNFQAESYRIAYFSAKALNKKDEALKYSELFIKKSERVLDDNKLKALNKILSYEERFVQDKKLERQKNKNFNLSLVLMIALAVLILFIGLYFYRIREYKQNYKRFQEIIKQRQNGKIESEKSTKKKCVQNEDILDEKSKKILKQLAAFENTQIYTRQDMSLSYLASHLGTNTITLSYVINRYKKSNFNDYINKMRIDFIICKLKEDRKYRAFKISHLAKVSGFSTHSLFSISFKKHIGMPPSQFIEFIEKDLNNTD